MKGRNGLRMKATADIHSFPLGTSRPKVKPGSHTRNLNAGGLVAVSRHLAVVLQRGGGGLPYVYTIYMCGEPIKVSRACNIPLEAGHHGDRGPLHGGADVHTSCGIAAKISFLPVLLCHLMCWFCCRRLLCSELETSPFVVCQAASLNISPYDPVPAEVFTLKPHQAPHGPANVACSWICQLN